MSPKVCRDARREIDQSEMNQALSDETLQHLTSCVTCSQFREERNDLRELVGSLQPVTAPPDFDVRLRARIAADRQGSGHRPFFLRFAIGTPAIAFAALVVMFVAGTVWYTQRHRNETPSDSKTASVSTPSIGKVAEQPGPTSAVIDKNQHDNQPTKKVESVAVNNPKQERNRSSRSQPTNFSDQNTMEAGVGAAEKITRNSRGQVSLSAPDRPLILSMQDDNGMTRRISLPPISFGSQRVVPAMFASSTSNTRSW